MIFRVIGLNHKTAPIEVRERFFLNPIQQDLLLSEFKNNVCIAGSFVLSTCNRTEVYLHLIDHNFSNDSVLKLITFIKEITFTQDFHKYFYQLDNAKALEHLLRVTAGLDSLVIGEKQILGQVKTSFERARKWGILSKPFNIFSSLALHTGKKVHQETEIGFGGASISWAAIAKAEQELGTLQDKSVLLIGAGKMGELTVEQISNRGFKKIFLMNRTHETALELAGKFGGEAVAFSDIKDILAQIDLCICSAGAPHYILDHETVVKITKRRSREQKIVFMDISMPRNLDPKIREIAGVKLYDIDELDCVVEQNMLRRQNAIHAVETIVAQKLSEYYRKLQQNLEKSSPELEENFSV